MIHTVHYDLDSVHLELLKAMHKFLTLFIKRSGHGDSSYSYVLLQRIWAIDTVGKFLTQNIWAAASSHKIEDSAALWTTASVEFCVSHCYQKWAVCRCRNYDHQETAIMTSSPGIETARELEKEFSLSKKLQQTMISDLKGLSWS